MTSLINSYEQQYSVLTAEITARIGKLKCSPNNDDKETLVREIQINFDEANDLLEQLELEVRGSGLDHLSSRVACYKAELERIRTDFKANKITSQPYIDGEESYDDWNNEVEQKKKLLDNSETIERTGKTLNEGYRVILETEQIGASVLEDLSLQRETIERSRNRLRETDEQLSRSSRLLNSMLVRSLQEKFALVVFFIIFAVLICVSLYFFAAS